MAGEREREREREREQEQERAEWRELNEPTDTADKAEKFLARKLVWDQYITLADAAGVFGVSRTTLRAAAREGRLRAQKVGDGSRQPYLVRPRDVVRYLGQMTRRDRDRGEPRDSKTVPV